MTDRLSKAERQRIRAATDRYGHTGDGHAASWCSVSCSDVYRLLNDLDAADAELESQHNVIKMNAEIIEQAAAREAAAVAAFEKFHTKKNCDYCSILLPHCPTMKTIDNVSDAARELLEIKRKYDNLQEMPSIRQYLALEKERDTLKRQRDVAIAALKQYADEDNCWDWYACDPAVFTVDKTAPWKLAQEALRAVEQDDA
jgi:hypothetical protein